MSGQQKPLRFNPSTGGYANFQGDDILWLDYTSTGYIAQIQKSSSDVFSINNKGEVVIAVQTSSTEPALKVSGRPTEAAILNLYDATAGDDLLSFTKTVNGSAFAADLLVNSDNHADAEALRITHDVDNDTPLGKILSLGYTNTATTWVEQFNFTPSGAFYLNDNGGADILWTNDGGGDIGADGATRPANVFAELTVVAGVATTIKDNYLNIGPDTSDGNRQINALQNGTGDADSPAIRYNQASAVWQLKQTGGGSFVDIATGAGNDLDQAYDAFGGSGQVDIDAGNLTWNLSSPYNFIIKDSSGTIYFDAEAADGDLSLGSSVASAAVTLASTGVGGTVAINSNQGITHSAGQNSTWTQSAGNWSVSCSTGNISLSNPSGSINLSPGLNLEAAVDRQVNITAGTDAGAYGFDIHNEGTNVSYIRSSNGGTIYLSADTTSTAQLVMQCGGNMTISSGRTLNMHVDTAAYDLSLSVPDHASSDILFAAHNSGSIPFNSTTDVTLDTTAQNIVGAINEVNSGGAVTWDDIYDNDQTLTIDGNSLTFTQTSTTGAGFQIGRNLAAASTDSPIFKIRNYATSAIDDQPGFQSLYEDNAGLSGGVVVAAQSSFESVVGVTGGSVRLFHANYTANAADSGGTIYGFVADGNSTGDWTRYGFAADNAWDYGFYGESPTYITLSINAGTIAHLIETASSGGIGAQVVGSKVSLTADATDSNYYYGYQALLGGTTSGLTASYGFAADADWSYGVYSESPTAVVLAPGSSSAGATHIVDSQYTSPGLASGAVIYHYRAAPTGDALDNSGGSYYGYLAEGTATGSATKRAFYADQNWDESFYGLAKAYISDSFTAADACLTVVSTSATLGAGVVLSGVESSVTGHASDPGTAEIRGFFANGTATGSAVKSGFYADTSWDYGLYSASKVYTTLSGVGSATNTYDAVVTTSGLAGTLIGYNFSVTESATDGAGIYGVYLALTPDGSASNTKRGFYADGDWDHGLYIASPGYVDLDSVTATVDAVTSDIASGGLTGSPTVRGFKSLYAGHASDIGTTIVRGFSAESDTTGAASKTAYYADANWEYGFDSLSPAQIAVTPSSAAGGAYEVSNCSYSAASAALGASDVVYVNYASITPNAADNASANYFGYAAVGSSTGSAAKIGFWANGDWDVGVYSLSKAYIRSAPTGSGSLEDWATESVADPSGSLLSNDEVAAFKATLQDAVGDDSSAIYYGLKIETQDNGPANKRGVYFDSTWPADQYATMVNSGIHFWQEDFGTVTGDATHFDINLSGLLNAAIGGRCINLNIVPDASQSDGSSWYGVKAYMANANANDSVGSFAFHANANWHYGLYVGNDLSVQQAPGEGTIHVESTSSSAVGSGTYYGNSYYHTRHASDTAGSLSAFYAQADSAATSALSIAAFHAGNNCNFGVYSSAGANLFSRLTGEWTALSAAVVNISNGNSSNTAPALYVGSLNTTSSGKCLEISHAYAGGDTEDTRRAIVFNTTQTNKRQIPTSLWKSHHTPTTTAEWTFQCSSTAYRWYASGTTARNLVIPLTVPHAATITSVSVSVYHGNVPTSAPQVILYRHAAASSTSVSQGSQSGTLSSGGQTITLSGLSVTVDNTGYDYYIKYINGPTASTSTSYAYSAFVTYEITDFSAGCGW